jgi:pimeloyl-ACP methyl ester carboxylesterase
MEHEGWAMRRATNRPTTIRSTTIPDRSPRSRRRLVGAAAIVALALAGSLSACEPPTPKHPVLIVGGTFGPVRYLDGLKEHLQARGFAVRTMQLSGNPPGTADITTSAAEVCAQIESLRRSTGATKVDVVGHSQGILAVRYCTGFGSGAAKVALVVSYGGINYGSSRATLCASTACIQMRPGSTFLTNLNAGDDTPGPIEYVHLYSREANGGTPGEDIPLADGATNVAAQQLCPGREVVHLRQADDPIMRQMLVHALFRQPITSTCP